MGPLRNYLPNFSNSVYYKQQKYLWTCAKKLGDRKQNIPKQRHWCILGSWPAESRLIRMVKIRLPAHDCNLASILGHQVYRRHEGTLGSMCLDGRMIPYIWLVSSRLVKCAHLSHMLHCFLDHVSLRLVEHAHLSHILHFFLVPRTPNLLCTTFSIYRPAKEKISSISWGNNENIFVYDHMFSPPFLYTSSGCRETILKLNAI
jgi:hypothetical protein